MSNHPGTQPTATNLSGAGYGNAVPEAKAGPHTSRIANAADPSVDSGLGSRNTGIHSGANTTASTGAPLHNSSLLNKLDPRVDSDMDGSGNMGATQTHGQTAHTHTGGISGYGTDVGPGIHSGVPGSGVEPGVHAGAAGTGVGPGIHSGVPGSGVGPGVHAGAAGTGVGPGVHTGVPGTGVGLKQTPGTGTATQTAGPHNSNLLNKLDPRVDSDMDGSQTIGGNRTYV
jgi:hypothetical protein